MKLSSRYSMQRRMVLLILCLAFLGWNTGAAQEAPGLSRAAARVGPEYVALLLEAGECFQRRDFAAAEAKVDEADKIKPDLMDALNLRGAICAEKKDFDRARAYFEKSSALQPNSYLPKFNIAEILLMQKKYAEARAGFKALTIEGGMAELQQFKVLLTYLGEGNNDKAREVLDHMKFPGDTSAYYFANAAWEFAHGGKEKAADWIKSANALFGEERNYSFYDSLADMGWVAERKTSPAGGH